MAYSPKFFHIHHFNKKITEQTTRYENKNSGFILHFICIFFLILIFLCIAKKNIFFSIFSAYVFSKYTKWRLENITHPKLNKKIVKSGWAKKSHPHFVTWLYYLTHTLYSFHKFFLFATTILHPHTVYFYFVLTLFLFGFKYIALLVLYQLHISR